MRQLPDWLRKSLGLTERFRKGHARHVPMEVEMALNDTLERLVAGPNRNLQTAGTVKIAALVECAQELQEEWQKVHDEYCREHGQEPLVFRKEAVDSRWMYRFLERWQWSVRASNKGAYLGDDSQIMQA